MLTQVKRVPFLEARGGARGLLESPAASANKTPSSGGYYD